MALAIIVVTVTWIGVIASIKWIPTLVKRWFGYMVEKHEPISQDNEELANVDDSSSLPSSSAESSPRWKYDVFLSFRGKETRKGIASELYDRLQNRRGIKTFMDDKDLPVGDVISPALLKAIKESRFAIIILSPNYASSTWCLEELRNICECMEDNNRVLPLFYNVDPADVRHQKKSYGDAFTKHENSGRHREKLQEWRDTLKKVADFSGWHTLNFKTDRELEDAIEEFVCSKVLPTKIDSREDFQEFKATRQAMDEVLKVLKVDQVTVVGVYGMGGVGKTTMVKQVGEEAKKSDLFDQVITAVVSQNPDLIKIQETLAELLRFKLKEKSESGRALRLKEKIMRETRILIILDDIWGKIEYSSIGIPSHNELQRCKSKVLLTTRKFRVCGFMDSHAKIRLNILSEEDSWSLFMKKARMSCDKSPDFSDVGRELARECAGLPIALVAVAGAVRDGDFYEWKAAAEQLKDSQPINPEDDETVFKCIKLSYDYLKADDSKSCFLLCCLFPEDYDIPIENLLMYGIGNGMFQHSDMQRVRARTYSVVKDLKDSNLLLDGEDNGYIRMHDVIRDIAISISSSEDGKRFLVKVGSERKNWPEQDTDKGCYAISLMKSKICELPQQLVCPNLQILLLQHNSDLDEIPESFFSSQKELRVLDLSHTSISILPQSISSLSNLRTLYLDSCGNIIDISILGKLEKLEILSMRDIGLEELSREIGQLTKLKMLDVSTVHCDEVTIPSQVISKLYKLEELYMQRVFWAWGSKVKGEGNESNIGFDELIGLSNLRILKVCMFDANCIPKRVKVKPNWVYFDISIFSGPRRWEAYLDFEYSHNCRSLSLQETDTTIGTFPNWFIDVVVKNTERLFYKKCKGLSNILVEYNHGRLHGLKVLSVMGPCENLKALMNAITCVPDKPVFESLEELHLECLDDTKELCVGELPPESLCNLKLLSISKCCKLGNTLLPSKLLQRLQNLEKLICDFDEGDKCNIKYVFGCKGVKPEPTKLREMELYHLGSVLSSICNGPAPHEMFQNLKSLVIVDCHLRGSLFTFDVAQCLLQLENLCLAECHVLERVIEARTEIRNNKKTSLRKLKNLCLEHLPIMYKGSATIDFECPSLENLDVIDCPHLSFSTPAAASDYFHSRNQVRFNGHHLPGSKFQMGRTQQQGQRLQKIQQQLAQEKLQLQQQLRKLQVQLRRKSRQELRQLQLQLLQQQQRQRRWQRRL